MENDQNWFKEWFNSPFYHLLYKNRDFSEADQFIKTLLNHLDLKPNQKVLDLACGKGRHSLSFNRSGLEVIGMDLSPESINAARDLENPTLKFLIGDMRTFNLDYKFDAVFNLFTSFGYFKTDEENQNVIHNIDHHLNNKGLFIIDYLNAKKVESQLPAKETVKREDTEFHIHKYINDGFITKEIRFEDDGKEQIFKEYVRYIDSAKFDTYLKKSNLAVKERFGNYELDPFDEHNSDRLIIIAEKK